MANSERYDYAFDPDGDAWPARVLRSLPLKGSVLELGPGPGAMTRVLVDRGYQVTVVESDPEAVQTLRSLGIQVIAADLNGEEWRGALEGTKFDAILASDVLEHLHRPEEVLLQLADLLAPVGSLVISLPNIAYAGVVASLCNGLFDYSSKGLLDRTHVRFFTRRSIEKMLMDCGWVPLKWDANRVPLAESEFAWCWEALPGALRQPIMAGCSDFDVYQWMIVASLSRDGGAWEMANLRTELQQLQARMQSLRLVHEAEHSSLLEHQKAFSEAKSVIDQFQHQLAELKSDVASLSSQKVALEAALQSSEEARKSLLRGSLRRLLHKMAGIG